MTWRFWRRPLSEGKIAKLAALAANPFAQPEVRVQKMERLLSEGSPAALRGVLQRFAANAQGQIADEEEKQWLVTALVDKGEAAASPLEDYIGRGTKLTFALRAYAKVVGDARAAEFFARELKRLGPEDHRSSEAKQQLLAAWAELAQPANILALLAPFLLDHSDDVRWQGLEIIEKVAQSTCPAAEVAAKAAAPERPGAPPSISEKRPKEASDMAPDVGLQAVRPYVLAQVTAGPTSARIARRAARLMCAHRWAWCDANTQLAPAVAADYRICPDGRLEARQAS